MVQPSAMWTTRCGLDPNSAATARPGTRLVRSNIIKPVWAQLDRCNITTSLGPDAYFDTAGQALDAFHHATPGAETQ
jgi:hypothetical protein